MPVVLVVCVAFWGGCSIGVGPTIGYRGGKMTHGGEIGTGLHVLRARVGASTRPGEGYGDGDWYKFGALGAWWPVGDDSSDAGPGVHGAVGIGSVGRGQHISLAGGAGYYYGEPCTRSCDGLLYFIDLGVRYDGEGAELYVRPSIEYTFVPDTE